MKKKFLAILFGTVLTLAACGGAEEEATGGDTGTTEEGAGGAENTAAEGIYKQSCAACHGGNLEGGMGPELAHVGGKLSKDQILAVINNGQGSMPKGVIQGADADAVAAWLAEKK